MHIFSLNPNNHDRHSEVGLLVFEGHGEHRNWDTAAGFMAQGHAVKVNSAFWCGNFTFIIQR